MQKNQEKDQSSDEEEHTSNNINQLSKNHLQDRLNHINYDSVRIKSSKIKRSEQKISPYIQLYQEQLVRGRKVKKYRDYWENFILYDIICMKQILEPLPFMYQILAESRSYRIIHYQVKLSYFCLKIKILNITEHDDFVFKFQRQINRGMFGTVYEVKEGRKSSAIKEIKLGSNPFSTIQNTIKEYAIMKILAALECGPALNKFFGFDLVIDDKCIYFQAEKCLSIEEYLSNIEEQNQFQNDFEKLQLSLISMHILKICHNDIKPSNIMYSPTLRKLVFIDFGFSELKYQSLGFMRQQSAKGSYFYSCEDMKRLFIRQKDKDYIDTYYNDFYGLMKSKQTMLSMNENIKLKFRNKQNSTFEFDQEIIHTQSQSLDIFENILNGSDFISQVIYQKKSNSSINKLSLQSDYFIIFITYLLSESRIGQIESLVTRNKKVKKNLKLNFIKYYWVFFEIKANISVETTYKKLKSIILKNQQISFETKIVIEKVLDPYFEKSLQGDLQNNQPFLNYMKKQQRNRKFFKWRFQINESSPKSNVRFENFSKKCFHKFSYLIPQRYQNQQQVNQQKNTKVQQKPQDPKFPIQKKNHLNKNVRISELSLNERKQIIEYFLSIDNLNFATILSILQQKLIFTKSQKKSFQFNIKIFLVCFQKAGIQINFQDLNQQIISQKNYFLACLNIFVDIMFEFMKAFKIDKSLLFIKVNFSYKQKQDINLLKTFMSDQQSQNNLSQEKITLSSKCQKFNYEALKNFQKCLIIFFKLEPIFSDMNSYDYSRNKIDSLINNLFQKITQTTYFHQNLSISVENNLFQQVQYLLFQQLMVFIYEIGINSFTKAETQDDIERLSFYFHKIFDFVRIFKKFPHKQNAAQQIIKSHSIFYFTKDLCCLQIYRSILPHSLFQKYEIIEKTERFVHILNSKLFQVESEHRKILINHLFWQHFNQLKNQNEYNKLLKKIDKIFAAGQRIWEGDMIRVFSNLYQTVNNNRKMKQMKKKMSNNFFDSFELNSISSPIEMIKYLTIPTQTFKQYFQNAQKQQNFQKKNTHDLSQLIIQEINRFMNMKQNQISFNKKWFCIRKLICQHLNTYLVKKLNIEYYIDRYLESLQGYQQYQKKKIRLFRNLPLKVSIPRFLMAKFNSNCLSKSSQKNNLVQYDQNQFWLEIYREQIFEQYSYLLMLLFSSKNFIQDKRLIFKTWQIFDNKVKSLLKGKEVHSLTYLQLFCTMKQFIYNLKLLQSQQDTVKKQELTKAKLQFFNSILIFLKECTPENDQFAYKMKKSKFFMDSLLKIYDGTLTLKNYSIQKAKERLIELFNYLVDKDQSYMFFQQNRIIESFLDCVLRFGIQQLIQSLNFDQISKIQPQGDILWRQYKRDYYEFKQCSHGIKHREKILKQSILQKLLFEVGSFAQKYPCSNYSKKITKMGLCLSRHLLNIFIKKEPCNYSQALLRIQIATKEILDKKILRFIIENDLNHLVIIYLLSIESFLEQFNSTIQLIRNKQTSTTKLDYIVKSSEYFYILFRQAVFNVIKIMIDKIQYSARGYSVQLINKLILKISNRNQKNYFYKSLKYFRSFRNSQLDSLQQIKYLNRQIRNQTQLVSIGNKIFQKKIKKQFFSQIIDKSTQKNSVKKLFLEKIKQKIIDRLLISVQLNDYKI